MSFFSKNFLKVIIQKLFRDSIDFASDILSRDLAWHLGTYHEL